MNTTILKKYKEYFDYLVKAIGRSSIIVIHGFDHSKKEIEVAFSYSDVDSWSDIFFSKKDGDLYISKSNSCFARDILKVLGSEPSEMYDEFIEFDPFIQQYNYGIEPVNSNFIVDIDCYKVSVSSVNNSFALSSETYDDEYDYYCNSNDIISTLNGNENEIFKRIFVKISDCPKWCQSALYKMRQTQLNEEQRLEEERLKEERRIAEEIQRREAKRQKRLALTRKIFPFLKK